MDTQPVAETNSSSLFQFKLFGKTPTEIETETTRVGAVGALITGSCLVAYQVLRWAQSKVTSNKKTPSSQKISTVCCFLAAGTLARNQQLLSYKELEENVDRLHTETAVLEELNQASKEAFKEASAKRAEQLGEQQALIDKQKKQLENQEEQLGRLEEATKKNEALVKKNETLVEKNETLLRKKQTANERYEALLETHENWTRSFDGDNPNAASSYPNMREALSKKTPENNHNQMKGVNHVDECN